MIPFVLALMGWNAPAQPFAHHSLIIDEVYPDPTPSLGLPSYEYIEVRNNTSAPIELRYWKVSDGSSTATIAKLLEELASSYDSTKDVQKIKELKDLSAFLRS